MLIFVDLRVLYTCTRVSWFILFFSKARAFCNLVLIFTLKPRVYYFRRRVFLRTEWRHLENGVPQPQLSLKMLMYLRTFTVPSTMTIVPSTIYEMQAQTNKTWELEVEQENKATIPLQPSSKINTRLSEPK